MTVRAGRAWTSRHWKTPLTAVCWVVFFGSLALRSTGWWYAFAVGMLAFWGCVLIWSLGQAARRRRRDRSVVPDHDR